MRQPLDRLCTDLGYTFGNPGLLESALTHRSMGSGHNNERLEFLGDAVLSFIVAGELYRRFPHCDEGTLSRLRALLVKGETLAVVARELHLGEYLLLGSGELKSGGRRRDSILADALEALIGAIYLDSGIDTVTDIVLRLFEHRLVEVSPEGALKDPKTRLQELLQASHQPLPVYTVLAIEGEAHARLFTVGCDVEGIPEQILATAASRRKAEQEAAQRVLRRLGHEQ